MPKCANMQIKTFSRRRIMRPRVLHSVFLTSFLLAAAGFLPSAAQAQTDAAKPAVDDLASKPIGKVVTATGTVTIEHVNAVIVQANVPTQPGQTKVGDLV